MPLTASAPAPRPLAALRIVSLLAAMAGAVGSVGLMLFVGRHNPSIVLLLLFAIWDLSPFIFLLSAGQIAKRWPLLQQTSLYLVTLIIALGSLTVYGSVALAPIRVLPASRFLMVPLVSWVLIAIALPLAAFLSGRRRA